MTPSALPTGIAESDVLEKTRAGLTREQALEVLLRDLPQAAEVPTQKSTNNPTNQTKKPKK